MAKVLRNVPEVDITVLIIVRVIERPVIVIRAAGEAFLWGHESRAYGKNTLGSR
jgi:hypothetical protein